MERLRIIIMITSTLCLLVFVDCSEGDLEDYLLQSLQAEEPFICQSDMDHVENSQPGEMNVTFTGSINEAKSIQGDPLNCLDDNYNFYATESATAQPFSDYGSWLGIYGVIPDSIYIQLEVKNRGIGSYPLQSERRADANSIIFFLRSDDELWFIFISGEIIIDERSCERVIGSFQGDAVEANNDSLTISVKGDFNVKIPEVICG